MIALTVVFFLIAAVILVGLRLEESEPEDPANRGGLWAEVSAGFRYLRHTPPLGRLTLLLGVGIAATGLVNIAIFPFLDQGVGVAASTIGVLVSIQGVGAILGGLTAAWAIGRSGEVPTFALGMAGLGIGLVPLMANSSPRPSPEWRSAGSASVGSWSPTRRLGSGSPRPGSKGGWLGQPTSQSICRKQ